MMCGSEHDRGSDEHSWRTQFNAFVQIYRGAARRGRINVEVKSSEHGCALVLTTINHLPNASLPSFGLRKYMQHGCSYCTTMPKRVSGWEPHCATATWIEDIELTCRYPALLICDRPAPLTCAFAPPQNSGYLYKMQ
jgi:hypothetical protein